MQRAMQSVKLKKKKKKKKGRMGQSERQNKGGTACQMHGWLQIAPRGDSLPFLPQ